MQDIPQFKKIRQWLFHTGYIQYIVDNKVWTADSIISPVQLSHFRAARPCYVNLIRDFDSRDVEDDKDDEFLDYIEQCHGMFIFLQSKISNVQHRKMEEFIYSVLYSLQNEPGISTRNILIGLAI